MSGPSHKSEGLPSSSTTNIPPLEEAIPAPNEQSNETTNPQSTLEEPPPGETLENQAVQEWVRTATGDQLDKLKRLITRREHEVHKRRLVKDLAEDLATGFLKIQTERLGGVNAAIENWIHNTIFKYGNGTSSSGSTGSQIVTSLRSITSSIASSSPKSLTFPTNVAHLPSTGPANSEQASTGPENSETVAELGTSAPMNPAQENVTRTDVGVMDVAVIRILSRDTSEPREVVTDSGRPNAAAAPTVTVTESPTVAEHPTAGEFPTVAESPAAVESSTMNDMNNENVKNVERNDQDHNTAQWIGAIAGLVLVIAGHMGGTCGAALRVIWELLYGACAGADTGRYLGPIVGPWFRTEMPAATTTRNQELIAEDGNSLESDASSVHVPEERSQSRDGLPAEEEHVGVVEGEGGGAVKEEDGGEDGGVSEDDINTASEGKSSTSKEKNKEMKADEWSMKTMVKNTKAAAERRKLYNVSS